MTSLIDGKLMQNEKWIMWSIKSVNQGYVLLCESLFNYANFLIITNVNVF